MTKLGNAMNLVEKMESIVNRKYKRVSYMGKTLLCDDLDDLLSNVDSDQVYFGTKNFVDNYYLLNPSSEWKVNGIFQIGYPFDDVSLAKFFNTNFSIEEYDEYIENLWFIFEFSKNERIKVKLGFNYLIQGRYIGSFGGDVLNEYSNILNKSWDFSFLTLIESSISNETVVELSDVEIKNKRYSFSEVKRANFDLATFYKSPWIYKDNFMKEFNGPYIKKNIQNLVNYVQIIRSDENGNCNIQKNDLVIKKMMYRQVNRVGNIDFELEIAEESKICKCKYVLRSFELSSFYIWAQFYCGYISDYCLQNELYSFYDDDFDISKIKIFISRIEKDDYYKIKYETAKNNRLNGLNKIEHERKFYDNSAKDVVIKDIKEIKNCFNMKAYKAAIILTGSVLEAFLIDWLSEIKGINYFDVDYKVIDKSHKEERRADLKDYIDAIEDLKKPSWFDAAKKATKIRKKRNLVHAKLYINEADISKETCTEVISYLEYVINTRWPNK